MIDNEAAFESCFRRLAVVESSLDEAKLIINDLSAERISAIRSELSVLDYVLPVIFGLCGALVSTSTSVRGKLEKIHEASARRAADDRKILTLAHKGDLTDKSRVAEEPFAFLKRDGSKVGVQGMHRLFFGHDPMSMGADNPFLVLGKQHGIISGVIQALRHLLADTFSRQGLPIPGHSFLDFDNNGNLDNWLGSMAGKIGREYGKSPAEAFGHLGTLRMQDLLSQGLTWGLCKIYIWLAGIDDQIRACQVCLVAYATHFLSHMLINQVKWGIPGINYPALAMTLKEFYRFLRLNYADLKHLEEVTSRIVVEDEELERKVFMTGSTLQTRKHGREYIQEIDSSYGAFRRLTEALEENA